MAIIYHSKAIITTWFDRFEVFIFAMFGMMAFAITIEGFWDTKVSWLERPLFALAAFALFAQDATFDMKNIIEGVQNIHIAGFVLLAGIMTLHKLRARKVAHVTAN